MKSPRGVTICETIVAIVCSGVLVTFFSGALMILRPASGEAVSMANVTEIGTAHALYAWDWGGLQWCGHKTDFGAALGDCSTYTSAIACPPQPIAGTDMGGGLWAAWINGAQCFGVGGAGSCGNWPFAIPNGFSTSTKYPYPYDGVFGAYRFMQGRAFHNYLNGRFYDEVYFAPNDRQTYAAVSRNFSNGAEFVPGVGGSVSSVILSSYAMSPAAMWNPEVFRAPSKGGFQSPSEFPDAFERQSLFSAAYPDLKSLVFELYWNQQPPASSQTGSSANPYRFNQGAASRPITLFYDGHVWYLPNKQAIADDAKMIAQSGDGLWSRDTPLGENGYFNDQSVDGSRTSHSILTIDGILGRDLLKAP